MRTGFAIVMALLLVLPARGAEPTTKPALLLLRFAPLNDATGTEWIGRAVQESLLTDAARISSVSVLSSQQTPTTDIATARQLARDAHAQLVVLGGIQTIGDDVKITGRIVQVESGEILGRLKSTATVRDVLSMEETLARQLERSLNPTNAHGSAVGPKPDLVDSLGPVRLATFTRPFAPPKSDPHQIFRDRYTCTTPFFYPYCYGYGYYGYYGGGYYGYCGFHGFNPYTTPTSIFYGD